MFGDRVFLLAMRKNMVALTPKVRSLLTMSLVIAMMKMMGKKKIMAKEITPKFIFVLYLTLIYLLTCPLDPKITQINIFMKKREIRIWMQWNTLIASAT